MRSLQARPPRPTWQAGLRGLGHPFIPWLAGKGVRQQDGCRRAALPDLVVAQAQHLQPSEAQEAPRDGLQLIVIQQQLGQGGMQA